MTMTSTYRCRMDEMVQPIDDETQDRIVFRWNVSDVRSTLTARRWFPFADHISILVEISFVEQFQTFVLQNRLGVKFAVDRLLTFFTFARRFVVEERFICHEQSIPFSPDLRRNQTETKALPPLPDRGRGEAIDGVTFPSILGIRRSSGRNRPVVA